MLDEIHESHPSSHDQNGYTLGRIGTHNIVVAVMPAIGNNRAASVAMQLLNDFQSIRFGLLVGIGSGVPGEEDDDIRPSVPVEVLLTRHSRCSVDVDGIVLS
jgi:hypothetical protein